MADYRCGCAVVLAFLPAPQDHESHTQMSKILLAHVPQGSMDPLRQLHVWLQSQELAEGLHSATDQLAALQAVQGGDRRHLETRLAHVSHELEQSSAELSRCQ